jgi:hypothetical protein
MGMSVRVLAFFDTRYQSPSDGRRRDDGPTPWQVLRETRPASRSHFTLNRPSTLGHYDLADPNATGQVVSMAMQAGIDGFVVDCQWIEDRYHTGARILAPACSDRFGLAFRWLNGDDDFWKQPAERDLRQERARRLITAITLGTPTAIDERALLIVNSPTDLSEPADTIALLREEARRSGMTGLYVIANRAEDKGQYLAKGFDALIDPGPADWHSIPPNNKPSGQDSLEVMAGLKDSAEVQDKFFSYPLFAVSRMVNREQRGKVFPRVFPSYYNWAQHPDGGATQLVNYGNRAIETYWFGLFLENALLFAHQRLPSTEQFVFLESWNGWLDGSQVEPSLLDGDLVYNATRNAIARGRHIIRTRACDPLAGLSADMQERIDLLCEAMKSIEQAAP